jgi:XisH protein
VAIVSAKDVVHNAIRVALEKESWVITADPLYLKASAKVGLYIDLGAEKLLVAERSGQRIAVEVKSFLGLSAVNEFHLALGQFLNYRLALKRLDPDRVLYLAVPVDTYETFFVDEFIQESITTYDLRLIVFNPVQEVIVLWKP